MATLTINLNNVQPLDTLLTGISALGYAGNEDLYLKVNATADGFEFAAAGGGSSSVSIGDSIGSATAGSVLFAGVGGVLAQSTGITYSDSNGLIITPTGTIVSGFKAGINIVSANPTLRLTDGVRGFGVFHSGTVTYIATTTTAWGSASYFGNIVGNKMFIGGTNSASAMLHIKAASATDIGLIAQGTTSQTGNLFEARNVSGTVMANIDNSGNLTAANIQSAYAQKTAAYTITNNDSTIHVTSGTFNVTLPTAVGIAGKIFTIINTGAGTATVNTTSSQTIQGSLTFGLATSDCIQVQSDGANWILINYKTY